MAKQKKLIRRILSGRANANISFSGLRGLLKQLGFAEQIRGDHTYFYERERRENLESATKGFSG